MANWCYNTITFSGRYKAFAKRLEKHNYNKQGFEIVKGGRCIFSLEKIEDGMYSFESKWIPPLDELFQRAKKGRFSFEIDYEELGCDVYGKAIYNYPEDSYDDYYLTSEILNMREWDDDVLKINGIVVDEEYEMEWLERQLERLVNNKNYNKWVDI